MPENEPNSVTVKVSKETYESLNDEQARIRLKTGKKPTLQEMLDAAWGAYMGGHSAGELELKPAEKDLRRILESEDADAKKVVSMVLKDIRARLRPTARTET